MTDTLKTLKILPFSGKEEDWNRWSRTFLATATAKGYRKVIKPNDPTAVIDSDKNVQAYSDLMLSCQEEVIFGIVVESVSNTFPDGDAKLAWDNLYERFEPTTGAEKIRLKSEFQKMRINDATEDPDIWINKLETLHRRLKSLGVDMSDEDFEIHVLNNLPKEYEGTIQLCEEELDTSSLTITTMKKRIRARFTRLNKEYSKSNESVALIMKNKFKGMCSNCGKIGHKGADCFELEQNKEKKEAWLKKMEANRKKTGRFKKRNNQNHQKNIKPKKTRQ